MQEGWKVRSRLACEKVVKGDRVARCRKGRDPFARETGVKGSRPLDAKRSRSRGL
ncbi:MULTISPECIES: hypothetical protein [unclassified Microcoleus]|uniref:hypothetical protein n=1 Tax=unclassified Microcoleus TaxID=2642155 RepID=UPI002FCFB9C9